MMQEYDFLSVVMYPDLKNRREFIHDCWVIAKSTENDELKLAVSKDPYFYLTRDDLLQLLRTEDNKMITHILETKCMLLIREDISYKLVSIKHDQVDKNQQTTIKLIDFISVLVENKREDTSKMDSKIIFGHNFILKFLEHHKKFVNDDEVIKIFILARRFRLSL